MQLKIGDILNVVEDLKKNGLTLSQIKDMPIYLGNDDELNGIHCGWYINVLDPASEDDQDLVEMINEDHHCNKINGLSMLIS